MRSESNRQIDLGLDRFVGLIQNAFNAGCKMSTSAIYTKTHTWRKNVAHSVMGLQLLASEGCVVYINSHTFDRWQHRSRYALSCNAEESCKMIKDPQEIWITIKI